MGQLEEQPGGGLVTLAEFLGPHRANVLRASLESQGIHVQMWSEELATLNLMLSAAGGLTKVRVPASQLEQAQEILAAFGRGELAVPTEADVASGAPEAQEALVALESLRKPHALWDGWIGRLVLNPPRLYLVLTIGALLLTGVLAFWLFGWTGKR